MFKQKRFFENQYYNNPEFSINLIKFYENHLRILDLLTNNNSFRNKIQEEFNDFEENREVALLFYLARWVILIFNNLSPEQIKKISDEETQKDIEQIIEKLLKYTDEQLEEETSTYFDQIDDFSNALSKIISFQLSNINEMSSIIERIKNFVENIQQPQ